MYIPVRLLRRHVRESNLIEHIKRRSGAFVTSHLHASVRIARGELMHPREIHRLLCRGTHMERFGGRMRRCNLFVGSPRTVRGRRDMPIWQKVPELLEEWWNLLVYYDAEIKHAPKSKRIRMARRLHDIFLCIHPFEDGNGRTARLIFNMLRLRWNLGWYIVEDRRKHFYYWQIRRTEEGIFKPVYGKWGIYPEDELQRLWEQLLQAREDFEDSFEVVPVGKVPMRSSIRSR